MRHGCSWAGAGTRARSGTSRSRPRHGLVCGCGYPNHWEGYCSGRNLPRFYAVEKESGDPAYATAEAIFAAARAGEPAARRFLETVAVLNARALSTLVVVYDPARIVLDGAVVRAQADLLVGPAVARMEEFLPRPEVVTSPLDGDAPLLGAAVAARRGYAARLILRPRHVLAMTPPLARAVAGAVDDDLLELYRTLHAHPELSGQEAGTAERLANALEAAGCTVHRGIGGHGVAAVLEDGAGPTLLVRADMDALPVEEATDLPYASRATAIDPNGNEVPVMHACGHDLHMAALVGLARAMQALRGRWRGRLVLVGQPSEERVSGAAAMIADGLYDRVGRPDFAIALHVAPEQPEGTVLFIEGTALGRGRVDRPPGPRPRRARGPPGPDAGPGPPRGRVRPRLPGDCQPASSTRSPSACSPSP